MSPAKPANDVRDKPLQGRRKSDFDAQVPESASWVAGRRKKASIVGARTNDLEGVGVFTPLPEDAPSCEILADADLNKGRVLQPRVSPNAALGRSKKKEERKKRGA
jgi:hypothetical protein